MARTDPPIKLKRSVLRRVVSTKLFSLKSGDFYDRNNLGSECYDPIVAEAKSFLDSSQYAALAPTLNHTAPQDAPPPPSLSDDFETFVNIISSSILIDASMRGENAGESDPRFIKKKKKLLSKTLKGIKFHEFITQIWRFDCIQRGVTVPEEEESEQEAEHSSESNSSEDDSDRDDTSVTSHTTADGFSTSASNSKRHAGSSSSQKKKHKKEKKRAKKARKQKRKEEKRRRKEEKRRKKLEKKKRKKEGLEQLEDAEEEKEEVKSMDVKEKENHEEIEEEMKEDESFSEIEHTTKEEFEAFKEKILAKIPNEIKNRFREGGFSRWGKDWLPVLEIGPFDVEPGPVRSMWMDMFHNTRQSGREMTRLVFWYGVKYEDRGQAYSFVPSTKLISYEEGEIEGYCDMPKKIKAKLDKGTKLTKTEEQIERGLRELQQDMKKDKRERMQWMMNFQEDYELAESMSEPDDYVEVEIKRKPGRPKKSESLLKDETSEHIKQKLGRPKKSESMKRKPGRPKKSEAEKVEAKISKIDSTPKEKKIVIVDEDDNYASETDDDDDKDYNQNSSEDSSMDDSDDADSEQSNAVHRKRKAANELEKPRKKPKSQEEAREERRQKAAEYREKKRRQKAEALGLDYVPGKKKSKKKLFEEEQARFRECETVFLPLIDQLQDAKTNYNVKSVFVTINEIINNVESLTPPFLRTYPLGMLVRDVRKTFESSDPEVKDHCKRLTNEMKRVYSAKEMTTPDDFVPKKRSSKEVHSGQSDGIKKSQSTNNVSMTAVKTEDMIEHPRTSEIETTDPVKTDPIKSDTIKPPKKTFTIKGMFEKPKPNPKPKVVPAVILSRPTSPKPKSIPAWVTGPATNNEFHEQHAKERTFALEFLNDAASSISSHKYDPMSVSQQLELNIFAETKLRGRDWNQYWEKVHDIVAMLSPGKDQPNSIMLGIARGDYPDASQLVILSRREIHSLNQQKSKSLI